jgi:diguanylate cyclase (GGDEF)-like protein
MGAEQDTPREVEVRLITRRDAPLASSLIIATIVLFNRPLKAILEFTSVVERQYDVDLLPALVVMGGTFAFHQYRKYREAAEESARVKARSADIERLLALGAALAGALDYEALKQNLHRLLPTFCGARGYWLFYRADQRWTQLLHDATSHESTVLEATDETAAKAIAASRHSDQRGVSIDGHMCFALQVGDVLVGVLGIRNSPALSASERQALAAAATFIGLALRTTQALHESRQKGVLDGLTGCLNRAEAIPRLQSELRRAHRTGCPLSLLVFDVDDFKGFNDAHGHLFGDRVLECLGHTLATLLRTSDLRCRMGGDEFLVVLPDTPARGAAMVAEKLRLGVSHIRLDLLAGREITISVGGITAASGELNALDLIELADRALYQAKRAGRNRCVISSSDESQDWLAVPGAPERTPIVPAHELVSATSSSYGNRC